MTDMSSSETKAHKQAGFTLPELLIAIGLGMAVLVALSQVYVVAKQAFRFQETSGRMQEDAAFALDMVARDLRMAGFAGCRGVDTAIISGALTYFPNFGLASNPMGITGANPLAAVFPTDAAVTLQPVAPGNFVRGFDSVPSAMFPTGSVPVSSNSGALYFVGGSSNAVSVAAAMTSANAGLSIAADPFAWGTAKTYTMVVSDCNSSSLFSGKLSGATSIDHSMAIGNAADSFPNAYQYGIDALVMPVQWSFYYAATRSGASTPSLYRVFYDGNARDGSPQEIIANVEAFKLSYGENTQGLDSGTNSACTIAAGSGTCVPTLQADVWRATASAVTDWSRVVAVRIGLMMVSADSSALSGGVVQVTPTLLGQPYSIPAGAVASRVRKEFSTTVVLRNRVASR